MCGHTCGHRVVLRCPLCLRLQIFSAVGDGLVFVALVDLAALVLFEHNKTRKHNATRYDTTQLTTELTTVPVTAQSTA